MKFIQGGVCAAKGFYSGGISAGLKGSGKPDLAMIVSESDAAAAAVYTKNVVKAAPIHVTKDHLSDGRVRAVVANSGNANACAPDDMENARAMCSAAAAALDMPITSVAVASTGVIGKSMSDKMPLIESGIMKLASEVSDSGSGAAAEAIMTTDKAKKECAIEFDLDGKTVRIGGIAKGSGMIHPNMGTMLCFITTDADIAPHILEKALCEAAHQSFNRISVDGDTSTNDMCFVMANAAANCREIAHTGEDYELFLQALTQVCIYLARAIAADGEGAGRLITCVTNNAVSEEAAEMLGKSVVSSSLFKAAIFGSDANWGRVLCAMGYSGADFDPAKVSVSFESEAGSIQVCKSGMGLPFDEDKAKAVLSEKEITVIIDMASGDSSCTCWGCDLTYEYVRINGDYRS